MKSILAKLGKWLGWCLFAVAVLYFGLKAVISHPYQSEANELPQLRKEAHALGFPLTVEELYKLRPVKDSENAANEVLAAITVIKGLRFSKYHDGMWADKIELGTPEDRKIVYENARKAEPLVWQLEAALRKPKLRFDHDWNSGFSIWFRECSWVKQAVRLAVNCAIVSASQSRFDDAFRQLQTAYTLADRLLDNAGLLPYATSASANGLIDRDIPKLLRYCAHDAKRIATLRKIVETNPFKGDPRWAWLSEFCVTRIGYEVLATKDEDWKFICPGLSYHDEPNPRDVVPYLVTYSVAAKAIEARYLKLWISGAAVYSKSKNAAQTQLAMDQGIEASLNSIDPVGRTLMFFWTPIKYYLESETRTMATRQSLFTLMDALIFRATHGRFPKDPSELPTIGEDPYSGSSLQIANNGGVFTIYSVGENKTDEKGEGDDRSVRYPPKYYKF